MVFCNNAYLIVDTDGLDPVFGRLDEILVIGGDQVVFVASMCKSLYFDDHYHAYAISVTSHRSLFCKRITMSIMVIPYNMESPIYH